MRGSEGTQSSAWESRNTRFQASPPSFSFSLSISPLPISLFFRVAHIICLLSHCNWQKKENLVIEQYRTRALPAQRWQMDYKNVKAKHLKHQGRDARYLNYHSLPRRQWLPDMVHTSRNSANGTDIIQRTAFLLLFLSNFSLALCYTYIYIYIFNIQLRTTFHQTS